MKDVLAVFVAFILMLALIAIVYGSAGAVLFYGLKMLGVGLTYWQSVVLAVVITTVGTLFNGVRGVNTQKEGD